MRLLKESRAQKVNFSSFFKRFCRASREKKKHTRDIRQLVACNAMRSIVWTSLIKINWMKMEIRRRAEKKIGCRWKICVVKLKQQQQQMLQNEGRFHQEAMMAIKYGIIIKRNTGRWLRFMRMLGSGTRCHPLIYSHALKSRIANKFSDEENSLFVCSICKRCLMKRLMGLHQPFIKSNPTCGGREHSEAIWEPFWLSSKALLGNFFSQKNTWNEIPRHVNYCQKSHITKNHTCRCL